MNITPKISATVVAGSFLISITAQAQNFNWDSGGGRDTRYEQAQNWDTNSVPESTGDKTMFLSVADGGTVTFDEQTGEQRVDLLEIGNGSVFNMSGGVLDHRRAGNVVRTSVGLRSGGATLNQSGGAMKIGHLLKIGQSNSPGVYNLSGGVLSLYRGGSALIAEASVDASISLGPGNAKGELNITGGSLETRFGVEIEQNATFRVLGTGALIVGVGTNDQRSDGTWFQKGTLSMGIGREGVTKIQVAEGPDKQQFVNFIDGSELDLSFHDTAPYSGTWTLLELTGGDIVDNGLVLSEATLADPNWSFEIDNSGPIGRLNAKYVDVPEPMSFALVLGSVCVFLIQRRKG